MKSNLKRNGRLIGGYVPPGIISGMKTWISKDPERDQSTFLRQAARKLLTADGIEFDEKQPALTEAAK